MGTPSHFGNDSTGFVIYGTFPIDSDSHLFTFVISNVFVAWTGPWSIMVDLCSKLLSLINGNFTSQRNTKRNLNRDFTVVHNSGVFFLLNL